MEIDTEALTDDITHGTMEVIEDAITRAHNDLERVIFNALADTVSDIEGVPDLDAIKDYICGRQDLMSARAILDVEKWAGKEP